MKRRLDYNSFQTSYIYPIITQLINNTPKDIIKKAIVRAGLKKDEYGIFKEGYYSREEAYFICLLLSGRAFHSRFKQWSIGGKVESGIYWTHWDPRHSPRIVVVQAISDDYSFSGQKIEINDKFNEYISSANMVDGVKYLTPAGVELVMNQFRKSYAYYI